MLERRWLPGIILAGGRSGRALGVFWLGLSTVQFQAPIIQVVTYPHTLLVRMLSWGRDVCSLWG